MDTISYWLYFGITVWNMILVLGVLIFFIVFLNCVNSAGEDCYGMEDTGLALNALCFIILSVSLVVVVIPLFSALYNL